MIINTGYWSIPGKHCYWISEVNFSVHEGTNITFHSSYPWESRKYFFLVHGIPAMLPSVPGGIPSLRAGHY